MDDLLPREAVPAGVEVYGLARCGSPIELAIAMSGQIASEKPKTRRTTVA